MVPACRCQSDHRHVWEIDWDERGWMDDANCDVIGGAWWRYQIHLTRRRRRRRRWRRPSKAELLAWRNRRCSTSIADAQLCLCTGLGTNHHHEGSPMPTAAIIYPFLASVFYSMLARWSMTSRVNKWLSVSHAPAATLRRIQLFADQREMQVEVVPPFLHGTEHFFLSLSFHHFIY